MNWRLYPTAMYTASLARTELSFHDIFGPPISEQDGEDVQHRQFIAPVYRECSKQPTPSQFVE
jgi:hypothetical protein